MKATSKIKAFQQERIIPTLDEKEIAAFRNLREVAEQAAKFFSTFVKLQDELLEFKIFVRKYVTHEILKAQNLSCSLKYLDHDVVQLKMRDIEKKIFN
jgi:hypothetical protein